MCTCSTNNINNCLKLKEETKKDKFCPHRGEGLQLHYCNIRFVQQLQSLCWSKVHLLEKRVAAVTLMIKLILVLINRIMSDMKSFRRLCLCYFMIQEAVDGI